MTLAEQIVRAWSLRCRPALSLVLTFLVTCAGAPMSGGPAAAPTAAADPAGQPHAMEAGAGAGVGRAGDFAVSAQCGGLADAPAGAAADAPWPGRCAGGGACERQTGAFWQCGPGGWAAGGRPWQPAQGGPDHDSQPPGAPCSRRSALHVGQSVSAILGIMTLLSTGISAPRRESASQAPCTLRCVENVPHSYPLQLKLSCWLSAAAPAWPPGPLALFDQCGGRSNAPSLARDGTWEGVRCPPGAACSRHSEWFWQCLPSASPPPPLLGANTLCRHLPRPNSAATCLHVCSSQRQKGASLWWRDSTLATQQ